MARLVVTAVLVEGRSKSGVARDYGVSRRWVITLVQRFLAEGEAGLDPRSCRPRRSPHRVSEAVEDEVVELRKELRDLGHDDGAHTIAFHLEKRHGHSPAVSTIWRILSRRGFVVPQPHKRPKSSYVRFEADQPQRALAVGHHPLGLDGRHRRRDPQCPRRPFPARRRLRCGGREAFAARDDEPPYATNPGASRIAAPPTGPAARRNSRRFIPTASGSVCRAQPALLAALVRRPPAGERRRCSCRSCSGRRTWLRRCLLRRWRCRCWTRRRSGRRCRRWGTPRCRLRESNGRDLRRYPGRCARRKSSLERGLCELPRGQRTSPLGFVPPAALATFQEYHQIGLSP
jgi:transposase